MSVGQLPALHQCLSFLHSTQTLYLAGLKLRNNHHDDHDSIIMAKDPTAYGDQRIRSSHPVVSPAGGPWLGDDKVCAPTMMRLLNRGDADRDTKNVIQPACPGSACVPKTWSKYARLI